MRWGKLGDVNTALPVARHLERDRRGPGESVPIAKLGDRGKPATQVVYLFYQTPLCPFVEHKYIVVRSGIRYMERYLISLTHT